MTPSSSDELDQLRQTVQKNRQVIHRLKERVSVLEQTLELACADPEILWLYQNREERMDPTLPLFAADRAQFHLARYQFASQLVTGKMVADIACGTGYGCRTMMEAGHAAQIVGVDNSPEAIQYAQAKHRVQNVEFRCADAAHTGLESESLDVVVSFETIEHVPDDRALLNEFSRLLKPQGVLVCSTPNQWPLEIATHHVRTYTRDDFCDVLDKNFRIEQLWNQNSGSDFKYNHGQPAGLVETTGANFHLAECFIAVARQR